MFTLYFFLATLAIVSSSKCPEDPLVCLLNRQQKSDSPLFTSLALQESNDQLIQQQQQQIQQHSTGEGRHHHHRHIENQHQHHQDGRFSLNDTQTAGCGENQTLNSTNGCQKCSKCPKNGIILRNCSTSHDTICTCERGSYLDVLTYSCKPCSPCGRGFGVWKRCTRHRDTQCSPCAPGFYSGVSSNELACSPCDKCTSNQIMLQECSRNENTVCIGKLLKYMYMYMVYILFFLFLSDLFFLSLSTYLPVIFTLER